MAKGFGIGIGIGIGIEIPVPVLVKHLDHHLNGCWIT
jgi:hypothetical protein